MLFPCLSSSSTFESSWAEIHEMGGVAMQFLGDMHFATKHNDRLFEEFDAKTHCSEIEEPDVRRKVANVKAFSFERQEVLAGVTAIPTPGHRPGAVSYLLNTDTGNVLFAGDSIWHDGSNWVALASKKNRKVMQQTLTELAREEFRKIFVNGSVTNPTFSIEFDTPKAKDTFLSELAEALG